MARELEKVILSQLEDLSNQVRGLRTEDIPNIQLRIALVEERASRTARVTAAIISLVGLLTSVAVACFK